jgi:tetratricopeptide (TPR) repeat protein
MNLLVRFYSTLGGYYRLTKDFTTAIKFCETASSLAISTGNSKGQAEQLEHLAWIKWQTGDYSAAQAYADEAQRLAKISANLFREATALRIQAVSLRSLGCYSHSSSVFYRARYLLSLCGVSGGPIDRGIESSQAEVYRLKSEYLEARNIHATILRNINLEQNAIVHAFTLLNIAQVDVEMGTSADLVQQNIDTAKTIFNKLHVSSTMIYCDSTEGALHLRDGDLLTAGTLLRKSLKSAWDKDVDVVAHCLERLGDINSWSGMDEPSYAWTVTFLVHSLKRGTWLDVHKGLQALGDMFLILGDLATATNLFTLALEGFAQMDVHRSRAECMLRLGDIYKSHGDGLKAEELWKTARPLFERSSQSKKIVQIDARLAHITNHLMQEKDKSLSSLLACQAATVPSDTVTSQEPGGGMTGKAQNELSRAPL